MTFREQMVPAQALVSVWAQALAVASVPVLAVVSVPVLAVVLASVFRPVRELASVRASAKAELWKMEQNPSEQQAELSVRAYADALLPPAHGTPSMPRSSGRQNSCQTSPYNR